MYGGSSIPPGARPVERTGESKLYPTATLVAGLVFVLLLIGMVILFRRLGGAGETAESLEVLWGAR